MSPNDVDALDLVHQYARYVRNHYRSPTREYSLLDRVGDAPDRFLKDTGDAEKSAVWWLGWVQGVLEAKGIFAPHDLEEHRRTGLVGPPRAQHPGVTQR